MGIVGLGVLREIKSRKNQMRKIIAQSVSKTVADCAVTLR